MTHTYSNWYVFASLTFLTYIYCRSLRSFACCIRFIATVSALSLHIIQAIACAAAYESEWPLLIICPSSARYHWEHELLKWLDEESVTKKQIMVVCKSKQDLNRGVTKVVIMSYELVRTSF